MAFTKHSIRQALSVLLLAWMLVHCQAPFKPEEEKEPIKEAEIVTVVTKSQPLKCPPDCSCTAEGAVDCAGVDLTEFPAELSDKTRQLSLQNNKIEKITVEHISHLHQLETLNLQNNLLTTDGDGPSCGLLHVCVGGHGETPLAEPVIRQKDREFLLDARVSTTGLFGDAVNSVVNRFPHVRSQGEAFQQFLPCRTGSRSPTDSARDGFRVRRPGFTGVVRTVVRPEQGLVLGQKVRSLLEKGAVELPVLPGSQEGRMLAHLFPARVESVLATVKSVRLGRAVTVKHFQRLLGLMAAASSWWLKSREFSPRGIPFCLIRDTHKCLCALSVWKKPWFLSQGPTLGAPCRHVIVLTDASLTGLGATGASDPLVVPAETSLSQGDIYPWASEPGCRPAVKTGAEARGKAAPPRGLEDEGFEMLEQLNYLYLANNKLTQHQKSYHPLC
ncbi:hypothetical protein FQN60_012582 [Etheostoma spectabile]|uniref:LRRNT domain-containing protein n=1 Tax=Etheostoma spectabile TaxID=54343 RepID=A0A5J5D582_9PERO|nr:hypothetical protein FQN60_012582 [Etheostoma spectabile]